MARPPLEIGEWGKIRRIEDAIPPKAICYFRDSSGNRVRISRTAASAPAAERKLKAALNDMQKAARGNGVLSAESTIAELGAQYFAELDEVDQKDGTISNYRSRYNKHILPKIGNVKLRQITVSRLSEVVRAQKAHPSTAKTIRVVLMNMFDLAVRSDAIGVNLAANTKSVKVDTAKVKALKPDKVQAMLRLFEMHDKVHGGDMYDSLLLLASTGTRTGELLAFEWSEFAFEPEETRAVVKVTGTLVEDSKTGKLKKQATPKSKASERGLTLPATAAERFVARWRESDADMVFPSSSGTFLWPNNYRRKWRAIIEETEFEGITPKAFRKAVATYLNRQAGRAAATEQLGHESEDITTKYYIEMDEAVADFSDHLEALVSP